MARIGLHIGDPANRMTLKAMLEMDGHQILNGEAGVTVFITDDVDRAPHYVRQGTVVLTLCTLENVGRAVAAMRAGVFGYILVPFQPGEAGVMVQRAVDSQVSQAAAASEGEAPLRRLEDVESDYIMAALRRCKNNQAKAARILGIGRNTLWRKLKKIETLRKTAGAERAE